jgi:hypothetical protein
MVAGRRLIKLHEIDRIFSNDTGIVLIIWLIFENVKDNWLNMKRECMEMIYSPES